MMNKRLRKLNEEEIRGEKREREKINKEREKEK